MAQFQFPSFDKGSAGTLLDSENAKVVKAFIEAFNNIRVVSGEKNELLISESNVVLVLNLASAGDSNDLTARVAALETLTNGLTRQSVTYCADGSSSSKTILMS